MDYVTKNSKQHSEPPTKKATKVKTLKDLRHGEEREADLKKESR